MWSCCCSASTFLRYSAVTLLDGRAGQSLIRKALKAWPHEQPMQMAAAANAQKISTEIGDDS